tara:strand:- start:4970 stop:5464 length:495 start_codon:yes stop_codon:yes gene_type:complete
LQFLKFYFFIFKGKNLVVIFMKQEFYYRYYLTCLFTMLFSSYLIAQADVADQQFLDNSDQFSDQHGVRLRAVENTYESNVGAIYLTPLSVREADESKDEVAESVKKNVKGGFSFSDMAKLSKKKSNLNKQKANESVVNKKSTFTFSNMASMVQKEPTENRRSKD